MINISNFRMKWVVLPCLKSYSEETTCIEVKINPFFLIKNNINRIAFENAHESTIIFSVFYLSTFLPNLRPLSFLKK